MVKKIEICTTSELNSQRVYNVLKQFTNNNTLSASGTCQLYLMRGEVPIDENGFFPKNFNNILYPVVGEQWPKSGIGGGGEGAPIVMGFPVPGTYTVTTEQHGQTITASVDVTETEISNFQILNRYGNPAVAPGIYRQAEYGPITTTFNWTEFPFEIPVTYQPVGMGDPIEYQGVIEYIPSFDDVLPTNENILVNWKNNRIQAKLDSSIPAAWLMTYAAPAIRNGEATWFYAVNYNFGGYFIGTVGVTGSGADLELDDVNIVQGKTYGINNLRIQIPTTFTY